MSEEQVVVADDDVGVPRGRTSLEGAALLTEAALLALAVVRAGGEAAPQSERRLERDLADVAGARGPSPLHELLQHPGVAGVVEEIEGALGLLLVEAVVAEVVVAALDQREREVPGQDVGQQRQVLGDELLLQSDVRRGDDDPLAALRGVVGRRDAVADALAGAGRSLGHDVLAAADGAVHSPRQFDLARARDVALEALCQDAVGAEHVVDVVVHASLDFFAGCPHRRRAASRPRRRARPPATPVVPAVAGLWGLSVCRTRRRAREAIGRAGGITRRGRPPCPSPPAARRTWPRGSR